MDTEVPEANNNLQVKNLDLQADLLQQDIKVSKYQNLPTASCISMLNYQNVSNNFFYHLKIFSHFFSVSCLNLFNYFF